MSRYILDMLYINIHICYIYIYIYTHKDLNIRQLLCFDTAPCRPTPSLVYIRILGLASIPCVRQDSQTNTPTYYITCKHRTQEASGTQRTHKHAGHLYETRL